MTLQVLLRRPVTAPACGPPVPEPHKKRNQTKPVVEYSASSQNIHYQQSMNYSFGNTAKHVEHGEKKNYVTKWNSLSIDLQMTGIAGKHGGEAGDAAGQNCTFSARKAIVPLRRGAARRSHGHLTCLRYHLEIRALQGVSFL